MEFGVDKRKLLCVFLKQKRSSCLQVLKKPKFFSTIADECVVNNRKSLKIQSKIPRTCPKFDTFRNDQDFVCLETVKVS